jgi:hypothetical protein
MCVSVSIRNSITLVLQSSSKTYMDNYIFQTALPLLNIKVGVPKPCIPISPRAAPFPFAHMVIEMDVYLLLEALCSNSIVDLISS